MVGTILSQRLNFQIAAVSLLFSAGCGGERLYPVTLSLSLADGAPVTSGSVTLRQAKNPDFLGGGAIGSDGACTPFKHGLQKPGLPAGTYQIAVNESPSLDADSPAPAPLFARRYTDPGTSGLSITIDGPVTSPIRLVLEKEPAALPP